jgi:hypothetical protein
METLVSRWKAAGLHLLASALIGVLALSLVVGFWFRGPLLHGAGGGGLLALLVGVDVACGPLLTLIVYKAGKRGMRFDMFFIATCQAIALIAGLWITAHARPVFLVYTIDRINVVTAEQLDPADLAAAPEPFRRLSWTGPVLVAAVMPAETEQRNAVMFSAMEGKDLERLPRHYEPYAQHTSDVIARATPLAKLRDRSATDAAAVDRFVAGRGDPARMGYLPLVARRDMAAVISLDDARFLGAIEVDPW